MDTEVNSFVELVKGTKKQTLSVSGLIGPEYFSGYSGLFVKSIDTEKRQITAYASTGTLDRYGDIVEPEAFRETMPQYMKNPVVLSAHQHKLDEGHSPVVGNVIKWWIDKIGLGIIVEFARGTKLADEYWLLYSQKIQRALSIGFSILESHNDDKDGSRINIITKVELYEISCVAVPANPDALSKSRQRKNDFVLGKRLQQAGIKLPSEKECEEFAKALYTGDYDNEPEVELDFNPAAIIKDKDGVDFDAGKTDMNFSDLVQGKTDFVLD
jgi:HK97 family phage prohead protease